MKEKLDQINLQINLETDMLKIFTLFNSYIDISNFLSSLILNTECIKEDEIVNASICEVLTDIEMYENASKIKHFSEVLKKNVIEIIGDENWKIILSWHLKHLDNSSIKTYVYNLAQILITLDKINKLKLENEKLDIEKNLIDIIKHIARLSAIYQVYGYSLLKIENILKNRKGKEG